MGTNKGRLNNNSGPLKQWFGCEPTELNVKMGTDEWFACDCRYSNWLYSGKQNIKASTLMQVGATYLYAH